MSLYIRVETSFYTHRKTLRLRGLIGEDAFWVPPRIWSYAAAHQPDGNFGNYSAQEIASLIDYRNDAKKMLQALLQAGFFDRNPLQIHDWHHYNGILDFFSKRARRAADARWEKERTKEKGSEQSIAKQSKAETSIASSIASSMPPTREFLILSAAKIGLPECEVDKFINFYSAKGWMIGKNKMKSPPHALANWKVRWEESGRPGAPKPEKPKGYDSFWENEEADRQAGKGST